MHLSCPKIPLTARIEVVLPMKGGGRRPGGFAIAAYKEEDSAKKAVEGLNDKGELVIATWGARLVADDQRLMAESSEFSTPGPRRKRLIAVKLPLSDGRLPRLLVTRSSRRRLRLQARPLREASRRPSQRRRGRLG